MERQLYVGKIPSITMNLMFQPQFEPMIVSGRKVHTIRPKRKVPLRPGQPLSLRVWTGIPYRSPQREFMRALVKKVETIVIDFHNCMHVGGVALTLVEQNRLAWQDGFETYADLLCWFINNHQLPFRGEIIYWKRKQP